MIELGICRVCEEEKPLDLFKKDSSRESGFSTICKKCANERNRAYRAANIEKALEYEKQYRQSEKRKAYLKKYNADNREKILAYGREYAETHKEDRKQYVAAHSTKLADYLRRYKTEKVIVHKRCPECRKHFRFNRYYALKHPTFYCPYCRVPLRRGKTLSDSVKNTHGFKIKVLS